MFEELSRRTIDNHVERELDEAERLGTDEHHEVSAASFGEENIAIRKELESLTDQLDIKGLLDESIGLVSKNPEIAAKNKLHYQYIIWQPSKSSWGVTHQAHKDVASSRIRAISGYSLIRESDLASKHIEWHQEMMSALGGTHYMTYRAQFLHILAYVPEVAGALRSPMLTVFPETKRDKQGRMLYETLTADYFFHKEILRVGTQRRKIDEIKEKRLGKSGRRKDSVEQNLSDRFPLIMSSDEAGYRHVNELFAPTQTKRGTFFSREISGGKANEHAHALVNFSPTDVEVQRARIASAIEDFILNQ